MKNLIKIQFILLSLLVLSCGGKKDVTSSKIALISGLNGLSSAYPGGVALFARNLDTGFVLSKRIQSDEEYIEFDNGDYEFLVMGWQGASPMAGIAACARKASVTLGGGEVTLDFVLETNNCATLDSKGSSLEFHSNIMGGNIPAAMDSYSVKFKLYEFAGLPIVNPQSPPTGIIGESCITKDSTSPNLNLKTTGSYFPTLDLPLVAEVYDGKGDCSGEPTRMYLLPTGLDENTLPSYKVDVVNIPLDDFIFVVDGDSSGVTFELPTGSGSYSYDFTVDWGDGSPLETVTSSSSLSHIFSPGKYIVRMSGEAEALSCDGNTSCAYITDVLNFGDLDYKNLYSAFKGASNLKSFSGGNTADVEDMGYMFTGTLNLGTLDLSSFDTSRVTSMRSMFRGAELLSSLNLSNFNTSSVTSMERMFYQTFALTTLNISNFDTSSVTTMKEMFYGAHVLSPLDLSSFDTSNVTTMEGMFKQAYALTSLDLSYFNTASVTNMNFMFSGTTSLTALNVYGWDTSGVPLIPTGIWPTLPLNFKLYCDQSLVFGVTCTHL